MLIHLELGRQWKSTIFYTFCVKRRVCIFKTKNLCGNDKNLSEICMNTSQVKRAMITFKHMT
jgi:hypothetical protein